MTPQVPVTLEYESKWFETVATRGYHFAIQRAGDAKLLGTVALHRIDWIHRRARTLTVIGEVEERGRGLATVARDTWISWVFDELNLIKL